VSRVASLSRSHPTGATCLPRGSRLARLPRAPYSQRRVNFFIPFADGNDRHARATIAVPDYLCAEPIKVRYAG
jgi:hypothetical protein